MDDDVSQLLVSRQQEKVFPEQEEEEEAACHDLPATEPVAHADQEY